MTRLAGNRRRLVAAALTLALTGAADGAAPNLAYLFPAGGQLGSTVTVRCSGEFDWPVDVWAPGVEVAPTQEQGELRIVIPHDLAADRIWLRLHNEQGASQAIPFLIGALPEMREIEPNDSPTAAQQLSEYAAPPNDARVTINGRLDKSGDVDAFAVTLQAGQTLVAAVAANSQFGSPMDAVVQVATPEGTVLAENHDDVGLDPRLAYTAQASGVHLVRVLAFPAEPNQRIAFHGGDDYVYRLTLTTGPYLTHAAPVASERRDLAAFELIGWNVPRGATLLATPLAEAVRPFEIESVEPQLGQPAPVGLLQPPGWAGSVRVRMSNDSHYVAGKSTAEPSCLLAPPSVMNGCIAAPGAHNNYRLPLRKDQPIVISVAAIKFDSPLTPHVQLITAAGEDVAQTAMNGPARDALIEYTPPDDGDFTLSVGDRFGHGGPRYFYQLVVRPRQADFSLSLDSDAATVAAGDTLELPVAVNRIAGADATIGPISIEALDLPPGVSCEPVVSEPSGETAEKVTLKLTTTSEPSSGFIRIQGSTDEPDLRRDALTPAKYRARSNRLWLTIAPAAAEAE